MKLVNLRLSWEDESTLKNHQSPTYRRPIQDWININFTTPKPKILKYHEKSRKGESREITLVAMELFQLLRRWPLNRAK